MSSGSAACSIHRNSCEIVCQSCGRPGLVIWDDVTRRNVPTPELAGTGRPFYERLSNIAPYPIELVCPACGEVAMTAYPSTALHAREKYN
jgi:hypothetical protein